ncbi:MAG: radical SAM protein, partial [bacterium]
MSLLALQSEIVYGPVASRRLGRSLGVNLMPIDNKLCSLNCAYCQYGWTQIHTNDGRTNLEQFPTPDEVLLAVKRALAIHTKIDYITFSGNGEPTLHPDFSQIVQVIKSFRDQMQPDVNLAILSNSTTCSRPEI